MNKLRFYFSKCSRVLLLLIIIIVLVILKPDAFWSWSNISTVLFQQAPFIMLMSFGMTLAIITKGIDKSMGSILVLSSCVAAGFIKNEQFGIGVCLALSIGATCGLLNGILITKVNIPPFIATYGVDYVTLGIAYIFTGGTSTYGFPNNFRNIVTGSINGVLPNLFIITLMVFLILFFITRKTIFGKNMYSCGHNINATMLCGVDTRKVITIVYVINGLIAAITGLLYMARLNAADPGISGNFTLDSIAAALIGGTSFGGGKGSVSNSIIGALVIVFLRNGMNIMGVQTTWQQIVVGLVIILSIVFESLTKRLVKSEL